MNIYLFAVCPWHNFQRFRMTDFYNFHQLNHFWLGRGSAELLASSFWKSCLSRCPPPFLNQCRHPVWQIGICGKLRNHSKGLVLATRWEPKNTASPFSSPDGWSQGTFFIAVIKNSQLLYLLHFCTCFSSSLPDPALALKLLPSVC